MQSARLVAELLDDIHQHPDAFANKNPPSEFLQHAKSTLFEGQNKRLANHLGISNAEVSVWCSGKIYPSLPRLLLIANCCGCCVSDILLGNKVILRKVDPASVARPLIVRQRWGAATKTSERLLAELGRIFESGSAQNLRQAARLLDVDEKFLRKLAPDIAARLVKRGRETMRREKIQREEARFDAFRQSFQELLLENIYPTAQKVIARMYQRTGRGVGYLERTRFHRRALHLEETALRPGAELDDRDSASKSVQVWKDVPCKTTNSCRLRR